MITFTEKIRVFTELRKIAITGVSGSKPDAANIIFRKFHQLGLTVFPVNPHTKEVEGTTCYPDLSSLPSLPEGVVIASPPHTAKSIMEECLQLGIKHVWLHSSVNKGSYDAETVKFGEEHGISVIPVGCPMMYYKPVDFGHKCMKWIFNLTGKIPRE
jgi:uncharacterized protein